MSTEPPTLQRYSLNGTTMGTRYSALFYAEPGLDESAIGASLFAAVDRVDRQMSSWKADSQLNRLNALATGQWLDLPAELYQVLATALRVGRQSAGAFDIGVGDLVNAWGFGPDRPQPDRAQIDALRRQPRRPAGAALELDPAHGRIRKRSAITLDLAGIAKGFGVDELARCLDGWGIGHYLVGIDGEMRARGHKADGQPWVIAIENPSYGLREAMGVMELSDAAIATSGDYRHWVEMADQRVAHTMHPGLGAPLRNRLAAVTVVAATCMLADAWATALLVLGEEAGMKMAVERGMDALFVLRTAQGLEQRWLIDGQPQPLD
ncbi:FAD:protein FMN transferase [Pseudomonas sp. R-28-1W-6]|uniref:FAD:protein FMN transferase n=1 Tax=Pseudomonas sp. R-28-1W-6 TaxID=2650101 RepID=UPI0013653760|nr:FAD:protein FMN transferase [Pseudomonas sp. R-28-1W-6]MWV12450.1 FAD:protein FMN transferase [Pseudomonas sp. R-28-1W-6]